MFHSLITFATLLTTGAHAIFGCCWHHDHAKQHAVCEVEQAVAEHEVNVEHPCDCHGACSSPSGNQSREHRQTVIVSLSESCPCNHPHDQDSAPCDEGHCQYLVNAKVELPSLSGISFLHALNPAIVDTGSLCFDYAGFQVSHRSASLLTGSLCVRDLTQIALI